MVEPSKNKTNKPSLSFPYCLGGLYTTQIAHLHSPLASAVDKRSDTGFRRTAASGLHRSCKREVVQSKEASAKEAGEQRCWENSKFLGLVFSHVSVSRQQENAHAHTPLPYTSHLILAPEGRHPSELFMRYVLPRHQMMTCLFFAYLIYSSNQFGWHCYEMDPTPFSATLPP